MKSISILSPLPAYLQSKPSLICSCFHSFILNIITTVLLFPSSSILCRPLVLELSMYPKETGQNLTCTILFHLSKRELFVITRFSLKNKKKSQIQILRKLFKSQPSNIGKLKAIVAVLKVSIFLEQAKNIQAISIVEVSLNGLANRRTLPSPVRKSTAAGTKWPALRKQD